MKQTAKKHEEMQNTLQTYLTSFNSRKTRDRVAANNSKLSHMQGGHHHESPLSNLLFQKPLDFAHELSFNQGHPSVDSYNTA